MRNIKKRFEQMDILIHLGIWVLRIVPISIVIGLLVALFLWLLEVVTQVRWNNAWLIFFLPVAGIGILLLYRYAGKNADAGNNLIMDEIHKPGGGVPARMTSLILFTTLLTHLFGGSAGREGTAVQMGGSLASLFARWIKINAEGKRILLMCGMAAGFGAVFGTPVTGAIFALEVLTIGRIKYDALMPCLIASTVAHITCLATGIVHTHYSISSISLSHHGVLAAFDIDLILLLKVAGAGAAFGMVSFIFAEFTHLIKEKSHQHINQKLIVPVLGGILVIGISYLIGSFDYLGLGVSNPNENGISILSAFTLGGADTFSWLIKLLLTAITLGMGFKGGEVTPLFFIGATLGNTLAVWMGAPIDLFAALGFIAVFAGATNTPLACTLMGVELFGMDHTLYYAVACFMAYYFSGHTGIYSAQRIAVNKFHQTHEVEKKIRS